MMAFALISCQKKCQQAATQSFTTITGQDWRLVSTSDPSPTFRSLNNTTFLIFNFSTTYTGTVRKVQNNLEVSPEVFDILYNIDPNSNMIRIQYNTPPDPNQSQTQSGAGPAGNGGPVTDYSYELGTELNLADTSRGYTYRLVPYQGIVAPDDMCSF